MKKLNFIKILSLIIILVLGSFSVASASQSGIGVDLQVGSCNNDGICEVGMEDMFSCPADCTPIVVPPEPSPSVEVSSRSSGSSFPLSINDVFKNLTIEVSYNTAIIRWKSVIPMMSNVKWGTSTDYKDGIISNTNFILDHRVDIVNLRDGTVYYFSIQAGSLLGKTSTLPNQVFRTLSLPDTTPPGNLTKVRAESVSSGITVSWNNPKDIDFDYVRVMKNTYRFYGSPNLGHLVYEGKGMYFTDGNVKVGEKYFYSLFSRDKTGNYSSGSLISVTYSSSGEIIESPVAEIPTIKEPLADKYTITQGLSSYDFNIGNIFSLSGDEPINIKTNNKSTTKDDDMWIEIRDKDMGIIGRYLFGKVVDKEGFVNVDIPIFMVAGYYHISIYKYSEGVEYLVNQGALEISKVLMGEGANNYPSILKRITPIVFSLSLLLSLIILFSRRLIWLYSHMHYTRH